MNEDDKYTDIKTEAVITAELVDGQSIDLAIDALILTHKNLPAAHHARYTNGEVEGVITTELVDGQSIDNAIDGLITDHTEVAAAHHALSLAGSAPDVTATAAEINAMCDGPHITCLPIPFSRDSGTTYGWYGGGGWQASGAGAGGYYYWGIALPALVSGKTVDQVRIRIYDEIAGASRYAQLYKMNSSGLTVIQATPDAWGTHDTWATISFTNDFTVAANESYYIGVREATTDPILVVAVEVWYT